MVVGILGESSREGMAEVAWFAVAARVGTVVAELGYPGVAALAGAALVD